MTGPISGPSQFPQGPQYQQPGPIGPLVSQLNLIIYQLEHNIILPNQGITDIIAVQEAITHLTYSMPLGEAVGQLSLASETLGNGGSISDVVAYIQKAIDYLTSS